MSTTSMSNTNNMNNLNLNMKSIPSNTNGTRKIASPQKLSHRRSRSFDINTLNKTFSKLNVQSNVKSEKRGIDKINEVILGNNKYFIPEKPVLNINTKTLSQVPRSNSFKTPNSEVDYNELLKSLDDLTSEVKNNKRCKRTENSKESDQINNEVKNEVKNNTTNEIENKNEIQNNDVDECEVEKPNDPIKPTLKHSGSLRYLLSLGRKSSKDSLKESEENNMPNLTDIIQNSKNYLLNLTKKNPENGEVNTSEVTQKTVEETKSKEEEKPIKVDNQDTFQIPDIKITVNSRKSSESTIYKSDNDQIEYTKRPESIKEEEEEEEEDNSIINHGSDCSVINLYSKNRDSINLDVYMNSEMFPNTPITPLTPDNRLDAINESQEEEEKEEKKVSDNVINDEMNNEMNDKELKDRKKFESLALPKLPPVNYGHKKSKSEVVKLPINKIIEKSKMRRTYSKDNLEALKYQDVEATYEVISNNDVKKDTNEVEKNPVRQDSIRYSNCHSINLKDGLANKRKSFLNQKNNNSNHLRKKQSNNRLSVNRSSINFQDMQNVKDVTKSFYVNNKNFKTTKTTNNSGSDVYYIKCVNNEEEKDNASIKLYRNTRKLSDSSSKRQRSDSTSSNTSNHSLPIMNNSSPLLRDKKSIASPKHKSSVPINKSSLSNQSFNADDLSFESSKVLLSAFPHEEEEDTLNLMTSNIEKDKSIEKMMNSLEEIKNSINGEKKFTKGHLSKPSWAKSSSKHSSYSSKHNSCVSQEENKRKTPRLEESRIKTPNLEERRAKTPKMEEKKSPEDNYYVASPQRRQYQSGGLVFSKRNSSLTRFSVVSARTRHSVAHSPDVAVKSKFYRYSVARNMNTYNNPNSLPIPSHHTKLCIPHFNPGIMNQQPIQTPTQLTPQLASRKDSIDSVGSQETLTMEGSNNTNRIDSLIYSNNNNTSRSFLFRDVRESKNNQNISNIISDIQENDEESVEEPPLEFNFNNKHEYNDNSFNNNINNNNKHEYNDNSFNNNINNNNNISFNQIQNNELSNSSDKKAEIVSKINVSEIPFIYNKEQASWETNMHTMSLYDDQNPKPKKNKKGFRKTFSIFKKNRK